MLSIKINQQRKYTHCINALLLLLFIAVIAIACSSKSGEGKLGQLKALKEKYEDELAKVKDSALKEAISDAMMNYAMHNMSGIFDIDESDDFDGVSKYETNPYEVAGYYASYQDFYDNYKKALSLKVSVFGRFEMEQGIAFPFEQSSKYIAFEGANNEQYSLLTVDELDTTSNKLQIFKDEYRHIVPWIPQHVYAKYDSEEQALKAMTAPVRGAKVAMTTTIPSVVKNMVFSKNDIGKTRELDSISVKLVKLDDNKVELALINNRKEKGQTPEDVSWFEVMSKDHTRQYLSSNSSSTSLQGAADFYEKRIKDLFKESSYSDAVKKKYEDEESSFFDEHSTIVYSASYEGLVDSVVIALPDYVHGKTIQDTVFVPLVREDDTSYYRNLSATLYSDAKEYQEADFEMDAANIDEEMKALDGDALMEKEPYLKFEFPGKYLSNYFLDVFDRIEKAKEVKAYDYTIFNWFKRAIPIEDEEKIERNKSNEAFDREDAQYYEFNTNWLKFDREQLNSRIPRYVTGTLLVNLAQIKKERYSITQLPAGITVAGNYVVVDAAYSDDNNVLVQARDARGFFLKKIDAAGNNASRFHTDMVNKFYFYGQPQEIIVYRNTGNKTVDYHFAKDMPAYKDKEE